MLAATAMHLPDDHAHEKQGDEEAGGVVGVGCVVEIAFHGRGDFGWVGGVWALVSFGR